MMEVEERDAQEKWERLLPAEIERRSFAIIESELQQPLDPVLAPIIKRVIHTTADFDYAENLTALTIAAGRVHPSLVIGVPVGFVHVVEAKEQIMRAGVPYIVARGRKGGSNVAAAIVNALLYLAAGMR